MYVVLQIQYATPWLISIITCTVGALLKGEVKIPTDTGHQVRFFIRNHRGPGTYKYGYDTGGDGILIPRSFKVEEKNENGQVQGEYGYVNPYGVLKRYNYVSDSKGYRVKENIGEEIDIKTIQALGGKSFRTPTTTIKPRKTTRNKATAPASTRTTRTTRAITTTTSTTTRKPTAKNDPAVFSTSKTPVTTSRTLVSVRRPPRKLLIIGPIPRPFFPPLDR